MMMEFTVFQLLLLLLKLLLLIKLLYLLMLLHLLLTQQLLFLMLASQLARVYRSGTLQTVLVSSHGAPSVDWVTKSTT